MQLKKRLTVARNVVTVSAMAAMLAFSVPAFASNDMNAGGSFQAGLEHMMKGSRRSDDGSATDTDSGGDKDHWDRTDSATATAIATCRTTAAHTHSDAIKAAKTERDTELKAAHDVFLAATKAARDQYKATLSASTSPVVSATGTSDRHKTWQEHHLYAVQARHTYSDAVKAAQKAYNDAKHTILATYRNAVKPADDTYRTARLACKATVTTQSN